MEGTNLINTKFLFMLNNSREPEPDKFRTLLADVLSEETKTLLLDLLAKPTVASHSLTRSDLTLSVPISPIRAGISSWEVIRIEPLWGQLDAALTALLWSSLFGRDFKVIHWNLLYRFCEKRNFKSDTVAGIFRILRLTSSLTPIVKKLENGNLVKRSPSWETNIRSGRTVLTQALSRVDADSMLKEILSFLPELPKKRPGNLDEFFAISTVKVNPRKPLPTARIGVGYKDKGSIGSSHPIGIDEADLGIWFSRADNFARFSRETQKYADASEKYRKILLSNSIR